MSAWKKQATELCRAVLGPEFSGRPIYILSAGEVPDWLAPAPGWCGATNSSFDMLLAETLKARGEWKGRGFATVINFEGGWRDDTPRERLETTLHELAHHVVAHAEADWLLHMPIEAMPPDILAPTPKPLREMQDQYHHPENDDPWRHHGLQFLRCCSLLARRASSHGFPCRMRDLHVAGRGYGLSSAKDYERAMGHEAVEREHESMIDVLRSPAPRSAQALFDRDTAANAA